MNRVLGVDYGLCECGCGEETTVSHKTDRSKGWVRGKPLRFRRGHAVLGSKLAQHDDWGYVLSDFELGWVAGLIEGEGSFTVKKTRRKNGFSCQPQLRVSMTDEDVIRRLSGFDRSDDRHKTLDGREASGKNRLHPGPFWFCKV